MYRIIVIEDDDIIRENMIDILTLHSFDAEGYPNGDMALHQLELKKADLILCDIMMPGIDGYEVLRKVKSNVVTSEIPFVFVTAKAEKADMKKGLDLGADDYLIKPFTMPALLNMINKQLDTPLLRQEKNSKHIFNNPYYE